MAVVLCGERLYANRSPLNVLCCVAHGSCTVQYLYGVASSVTKTSLPVTEIGSVRLGMSNLKPILAELWLTTSRGDVYVLQNKLPRVIGIVTH